MRSRIIVFVALLAILVGGYGIYDSLTTSKSVTPQTVTQAPEPKQNQPEYITVWRLKQDVSRGEAISGAAVQRQQMELTQALDLGMRADVELDFSPTTLFNSELKAGDLVQPEHLTLESDSGYIDLLVTEGMTLYPLVVSNKNLISDYIRPGEHIDILTVSSPRSNLSGAQGKPNRFRGVTATLFLQNIKVLNMGSGDNEEDKVRPAAGKQDDGFTTIIIEIPPSEVARLALAQRTMHLEVYRSREYQEPVYADVRNVIDNYVGVEELRGSTSRGQGGEL
ncbi:Flp pilus assembly protein CpaB [Vibrio hippocampi]|uniref:Flp pilus assembly protein RcpC/CpaB domain-containing protein n=1 Tax=Vibrio hippocampi TaxID=654686 RepID=A0ABM8ZLT8_9VIBR|nr:Flp pilus assembly protein CpaB [Vibrio hippocampi]CAH0529493.1 hypothetical protein VHP8226_03247 [Vibrio hippocampi]